jgi:phosphatidylglycerol:prolipoprotein diacylglycerol transferase
VKFPKSLFERENAENLQLAIQQAATSSEEVGAITATLKQDNYEYFHVTGEAYEKILEIGRRDPEVLKALADHTPARHASQLYEGVLEGALIFAALYAVRVFLPRLAHGVISGCFFISYAIFRILVENVRQPDAEKIMGVTKGQFYSFFMIAVGIGFLIYAAKSKKGLSASRE